MLVAGALVAPGSAWASPSVVIALFPSDPPVVPAPPLRTVLDRLAAHPELAIGMVSARQGPYDPVQSLLDITQGARISSDLYTPRDLPYLRLSGRALGGWPMIVARAAASPARILPGLLGGTVPGGAAFAGIEDRAYPGLPPRSAYSGFKQARYADAALAASPDGRIAAVSVGSPGTAAARAEGSHHRLTVVELPPGRAGASQLGALLGRRPPDQLVIALQWPANGSPDGGGDPAGGSAAPAAGTLAPTDTLWVGIAGLRSASGGMLSSETTHVSGFVSATDIAPTVLRHLGLPVPSEVNGQPITASGRTDVESLVRFRDRLGVTDARKLPTLKVFLLGWGVLVLLLGLAGPDRSGLRAGLRAGGPAVLWLPPLSMLAAGLSPTRTAEIVLIAGGALVLGAVTDRLVAWPRAPAVPALVGLVVWTVDLARGSPLLDRSLLSPSPLAGVRFYGVDNDVEIAITLLLLAAFAGIVGYRGRSNRSAGILLAGGVALALVVCPGRLGADVGGIFTIAAGVGVGALMLMPRASKRALALVAVSPVLGLGVLAVVDIATGGDSHFVRTILHADSAGDIGDLLDRRYEVSWDTLSSGFQYPLYTALALLLAAYAFRFRERLFAGVDAPWRAFLGGGFAAALACALFNDSGPVELIQGVGVLTLMTAYLRDPSSRAPQAEADPLARVASPPLATTSA
ncbi:MAG: hypothetical protein QOE27_2900 [Solirubrobacteraceae bacterium]|nr:hypothetical protein [Solirubrobacteraceae bacterium]